MTTQPFAYCLMDFITDLPPVNGFDSLLIVIDQGLTKGVILVPCKKSITAEETAQLLLENLYKRFDKIISDRGPQFASKAFIELLKLLGVNPHYLPLTILKPSAWKSSLKTAKKLRPNRTQTTQDRKFPGPSKTATAVRSSVHPNLEFAKTDENRFTPVSTGLSVHKF
jgi:hypothetical protein